MEKLNVSPDAAALALNAARRVAALLAAAIGRAGSARLCLTGGQTPREMYSRLAAATDSGMAALDWTKIDLFWGDERHVPPDHPDSNFGMANATLVQPAAIPSARVHRMRGELPDAAEAAREYDGVVRRFARKPASTFDVMLLGLGTDAHIASLFPHSPLLEALATVRTAKALVDAEHAAIGAGPRAAAIWAPHLNAWRITLTPTVLLDSDAILVITSGVNKSDAVRVALRESEQLERFPAQLLRAAGERVEWWVDRDAAAAIA
jgi:6-phosphogluconolactonase